MKREWTKWDVLDLRDGRISLGQNECADLIEEVLRLKRDHLDCDCDGTCYACALGVVV